MVVREVIVEADFPHRDHTGMTGQLAQLAALGGVDRITGRVRMAADGCGKPRDTLCQLHARPVVGGIVADVDHGLHADRPRLLQRLLRREALAQVQEMGVRIDQATGSGFSIRGKRTPPSTVWVRGASLPHSRAVAHGAFKSALICVATLPAVSGRKGEMRYDVSRIASTRLYITVCSRLRWSDCLANTQGALSSMYLLPRLTASQMRSRAPVKWSAFMCLSCPRTARSNAVWSCLSSAVASPSGAGTLPSK